MKTTSSLWRFTCYHIALLSVFLGVKALAQTAGAMVMYALDLDKGNRVVYFMTIEKARFRRPVRPGDMLCMKVRALRRRGPVWRFSGEACFK